MVGILLKTKVGEKGQIVIPKPVRRQLNIHKDTELLVGLENDKIFLTKQKDDMELLHEFFNAFKKEKMPKHIDWDELYYSQFEK